MTAPGPYPWLVIDQIHLPMQQLFVGASYYTGGGGMGMGNRGVGGWNKARGVTRNQKALTHSRVEISIAIFRVMCCGFS